MTEEVNSSGGGHEVQASSKNCEPPHAEVDPFG
jgi:hypothetical protein